MLIASDETQNKPERTRLLRLARNPSFVLLFPSSNPIQRNLDDRATTPPPIPSQSLNRDRLNPLNEERRLPPRIFIRHLSKNFSYLWKIDPLKFPDFYRIFPILGSNCYPIWDNTTEGTDLLNKNRDPRGGNRGGWNIPPDFSIPSSKFLSSPERGNSWREL